MNQLPDVAVLAALRILTSDEEESN